MRLRYYCPDCLTARDFTGGEPGDYSCARCSRAFSLAAPGSSSGAVERCAFCGNRAFFVQKDFDQRLGCLAMAVSLGLAALAGWRFGWIWFTPVLLASVLVDWAVAARIGTVTICYRCDAEYRDAGSNPRHRAYDPHVAERFAEIKTVRRMR
jgi:DNA-directed RNA polymerase subunit RPC12/RpoP